MINMKKLELLPTDENISKTLEIDVIGRNKDVLSFINMLNAINTSFSIAIDGDWGSGKTFFVKQCACLLNYQNKLKMNENEDAEKIANKESIYDQINATDNSQLAIYYDAWSNDNDVDPVLSIVYRIISTESENLDAAQSQNIGRIATGILDVITGRNVTQLLSTIKDNDELKGIKHQKMLQTWISDLFDSVLQERADRLVLFIDELDRCKPSYAVTLLERIKHYFCDDRITFVFSINSRELQHTIKQYYGKEFDGNRYLDRFFDLRMTLPPANMQAFYQYIGLKQSNYTVDTVCIHLCEYFNFGFREITRFFEMANIAVYKPTHENRNFPFGDGKVYLLSCIYIVPILLALKMHSIDEYEDFVSGKNGTVFYSIAEMDEDLISRSFDLLEQDESYTDGEKNTKVVTKRSKLEKIYNAIFCTDYSKTFGVTVGELQFDKNSKNDILQLTSLTSKEADFSL